MWKFADPLVSEDFAKKVAEGLDGIDYGDACSAVSVWDQLRSCLVTSAIKVVGSGGCRQPDWFLVNESEQLSSPLLTAKKHAWDQVLFDDSPSTHRRFRQCERAVKKAVADAKEG